MPTPEQAGERLRKTALRDFGPPIPREERDYDLPSYRVELSPHDAPVPPLLRHALALIGIPASGPGEKVAWWTDFTYKGYPCELAHQKFGVRLRMGGDLTEEQARGLLAEAQKKLLSAVRTVERLLAETAGDTLNAGDVSVVNQHRQLRRAYDYFRDRSLHPVHVEDVTESGTSDFGTWTTFLLGKNVMAMHAAHDLIAAMTAYLSSLEHDLVLALPFLDFDPKSDSLTAIIGSRWGEKWKRVIGHADPEGVRLRERLTGVVERWRNPYSHGGFEKDNGATIYLHTPGVGALPVGMTSIRDSPLFSFHSVSESQIEDVFALFDEIDAWLANKMPHAMDWIHSGLDVRFDADFRKEVARTMKRTGSLAKMIDAHSYRQDMVTNMDY